MLVNNHSLGKAGNLTCPTEPTACCLLKHASINYLLFSIFKFLKLVRFIAYEARLCAFSITGAKFGTIPSIILFYNAYF